MNFKEHQQYTISEEKSESQELRDNNLIIVPRVKSRIGRVQRGYKCSDYGKEQVWEVEIYSKN